MGKSGESINTTHQQKKLDEEDLLFYRDRFNVPLTDKQVKNIEYYKPAENSPEIKYLKDCRVKLVVTFLRELLLQNQLKHLLKIYLKVL